MDINNDITTKEVFTRNEAAEYLQIGLSTLDKLKIPCLRFNRIVRFKKSSIDKWIELQENMEDKNGK